MARALARNAKINQEKVDNHESVISMVKTRMAAADAHMDAARSSLESGLEATKALPTAESQRSIET